MGCLAPGCSIRTRYDHCEHHAQEKIGAMKTEIRQLKGALKILREVPAAEPVQIDATMSRRLRALAAHLKAVASLAERKPTPTSPRMAEPPPNIPTRMLALLHSLSGQLGVNVGDLCGPSKRPEVVGSRHLAMAAIKQLTGASLPVIGRAFRRHHTSVLYAIGRADRTEVARLVAAISKIQCPLDVARIGPSAVQRPHEESISSSGHLLASPTEIGAAAADASRAASI